MTAENTAPPPSARIGLEKGANEVAHELITLSIAQATEPEAGHQRDAPFESWQLVELLVEVPTLSEHLMLVAPLGTPHSAP